MTRAHLSGMFTMLFPPHRGALALLLSLCASTAAAATLQVGVGKPFTTIQAAANAANPGDIIEIFAGTYSKGAKFLDDNLLIRLAPGQKKWAARIKGPVDGKGIFIIKGNNATVEGLRFDSAIVPDGNGAGIRQEGGNLTVRNCYFAANEMGILATPVPGAEGPLTVTGSTFTNTRSRKAGSIGHGLYAVGGVTRLSVSGSTFTKGTAGHYIKSRAADNRITGNTINDSLGEASYLIDVSEGGTATIADNIMTKGAEAQNCCTAIAYGAEMYKGASYQNPAGPVLIQNNRFTNKRASTVNFVNNLSTPVNPVVLRGNVLVAEAGTILPLKGAGTVE
jgi:hypothetical protein